MHSFPKNVAKADTKTKLDKVEDQHNTATQATRSHSPTLNHFRPVMRAFVKGLLYLLVLWKKFQRISLNDNSGIRTHARRPDKLYK
jgi:hypothetical protein